ncbi:MAG: hypothetical protein AAFY71_22135 [Bacteroidota bacterium]
MPLMLAHDFRWDFLSFILCSQNCLTFSYQIDTPWLPFVLAALASAVIALLTVSHQAYVAAVSNPVKALKYE